MPATIPAPARPICTDYTAETFENLTVGLFELFKSAFGATRKMSVEKRTFRNCTIEGPGVILALSGVLFDACDMGYAAGDPRTLLLKPLSPERVTGAVPIADCKFESCNFIGVGFTGAENFLDEMIRVLEANAPPAANA